MSNFRRHLTFANVCSFIALTVALTTGGAYAANTILSSDIVDGEVKTADLGNQAVSSAKLEDDSIDASKVASDSLTTADLAGVDEIIDYKVPGGEIGKGCSSDTVKLKGLKRSDFLILLPMNSPRGVIVGNENIPEDGKFGLSVCNLVGPVKQDQLRLHVFTLSRRHAGTPH